MSVPESIRTIIATDCGSTTTKAILIERQGEEFRLVARGEAPTTVEAPFDDVTLGVLNAIGELEDLTGRRFLEGGRMITPRDGQERGSDLYLSTSSAGGGLQMLVAGVVRGMSAESAQRAALGAGAIVIDVLAVDDGRVDYQRVECIRNIRPDMILLSGGTDGGTTSHLLDLAELLRAADPKPRLGSGYQLPVIYAGNREARAGVAEILQDRTELIVVDNIRPTLEREHLQPAREAIHRLFLEHVMAQAPGYGKLMSWTSAPIMPTPAAVGEMVKATAQAEGHNVLAVDIGGATTDVFSVFGDTFNRTVSANLGMSYSIFNVVVEAGLEGICRWLPTGAVAPAELRDRLRNKMIRPTTIPQTRQDLLIEQAVAREALRLALGHHRQLAVSLKGVHTARSVGDMFTQEAGGASLVDMMSLGLVIGSGGVLSHAPRRHQAAMMMVDAFQPEGVTELAVDSIFMMPQLGVLAQEQPEIAAQVFRRDCLVRLGTVVAPAGPVREGRLALMLEGPAGQVAVGGGELVRLELGAGESMPVRLVPGPGLDLGAGRGKEISVTLGGGVVGIILDGRGRPLALPREEGARQAAMQRWLQAAGAL